MTAADDFVSFHDFAAFEPFLTVYNIYFDATMLACRGLKIFH